MPAILDTGLDTGLDTESGTGPNMPGADSDALLLSRFAAGDQEAARILAAQLLPGVMRQAWRILGNESDAEDVAQDAMLKLWRQAGDWRAGEARASTWLYRVTHNLCIDRIRKRRPMAPIEDIAEPPDPTPGVLERMMNSEESRVLARAILALPDRQRQALVLRHFEGISNPGIGERLECSVEAVESLLARARRQLTADMSNEREVFDDD
jgi:RNA polymerase sigma factor (sigma-70 family)